LRVHDEIAGKIVPCVLSLGFIECRAKSAVVYDPHMRNPKYAIMNADCALTVNEVQQTVGSKYNLMKMYNGTTVCFLLLLTYVTSMLLTALINC